MSTSTWDFVVVGSGGGPDETNLSAYLVKPSNSPWEAGIVALEAGSGQGALKQILKQTPDILGQCSDEDGSTRRYTAHEIFSYIRCFLITHAHLDHVSSLVLSAGSLGGPRKRLFGTPQVLKDLETVFSDRVWPNLASWEEADNTHKYLYTSLRLDAKYRNIHNDISVRTMPLSHGQNDSGLYESSAFFIRHDVTAQEFLFFGDVEPDSVAAKPQTINIWRAAAAKIPGTLRAVFIECSWPSGRPDHLLYGHLTPEHLAAELSVLATEVVRFRRAGQKETRPGGRPARKKKKANPITPEALYGALDGLRVYVIHCKDSIHGDCDQPMNHVITDQVRALVEERRLGAEILAVDQGMRIEI
ncbi:hypothetical protein PLICRDRAFT_40534 [Plicaturopsis crispa FD-325 SS-3]|nr:hypothetical protein PLICRDRAFT_40534 [Plicaturopsis crispa FD-325 SS-3]